jgi:hypothetical protein
VLEVMPATPALVFRVVRKRSAAKDSDDAAGLLPTLFQSAIPLARYQFHHEIALVQRNR